MDDAWRMLQGLVVVGLVLASSAATVGAGEPVSAPGTRPRVDPASPLKLGRDYYPPESLAAREQGICKVAATVTADGWVKDAHIQQSTGFPRLDQACLNALEGVHLIPATENGVAVETTIVIPMKWSLSK